MTLGSTLNTTTMTEEDQNKFSTTRELHFDDRELLCYANRPKNLVSGVARVVQQAGDEDAVVDQYQRLGFDELWQQSGAFSVWLQQEGIKPGERVALALSNRVEFVVALLAILRIGAIVVPVNIRESASGFEYILGDCEAAMAIVDDGLEHLLPRDSSLRSLRQVVVGAKGLSAFFGPASEAPTWQADEEDPAVLLYTSGTTGNPKGAILTHFNIIHTTLHYEDFWQLEAGERAILAVPASHVTGIVAIIFTNLLNAGCTVMMPKFDPKQFVELAVAESLTWTILVPAMYNLILQQASLSVVELQAWRVGGFGGAPMPAATVDALASALPDLELLNAYGSTECASVVTTVRPGGSEKSATTVGEAVTCCEIRVVVDNVDVEPGQPGELWLRGPNTVPGYWNKPDKTSESFVDGFWRSGDLGFVDSEGFVVLHDRIDDVINRGGYKIYGVEIENQLIAHPAIIEAAVIGRPDEILGQALVAHIYSEEPSLDRKAVRAFCKQTLASYKTLDDVVFCTESLPRNANGKVLKRKLRDSS